MFILGLFVVVCLLVQAAKDEIVGEEKPVVKLGNPKDLTLRVGGLHQVAMCGCEMEGKSVKKPCAAHEAMLRAQDRG